MWKDFYLSVQNVVLNIVVGVKNLANVLPVVL